MELRRRLRLAWMLAPCLLSAQEPPPAPLGLPTQAPWPANNPYSAARAELGRILFFDGRLSSNNAVACAFCHAPERAFSGAAIPSRGVDGQTATTRRAPTLINRAWGKSEFYDGRALSLEEQTMGPITNPHEMGMTTDALVKKLAEIKGYAPLFGAAFGDANVTYERVAMALATFERTIVSGDSAYDRYVAGDKSALSKDAKAGWQFFNGKGECAECHNGPNFSNEKFVNLGVGMDKPSPDPGRENVTHKKSDFGKFKVPTLRDLKYRAPYMHDGSFETLSDVLDFYANGGLPNPGIDERILKFYMDAQIKRELLAFLDSLNGEAGWRNIRPPSAFPQ